jgi:electron transfer flavoprotein alpha/beta subunit
MQKPIEVMNLADLGLSQDEVGRAGSRTILENLSVPPRGRGAEILEGAPEEVSAKLVGALRERGVV